MRSGLFVRWFAFCRCFAAFGVRPCAAFGCGSSRVAASGGQGGPGGLRFPPRPSLDSPLPRETPPLRGGVGGGGAARSYAALCLVANGYVCCSAFFRCPAGCVVRPCAAFGCGSSRVAASGGQGGPGGLRVPPTPSLDSLLTPLYRRRSAEGLEAAERCVLARRSAIGARGICGALHSAVALLSLRRVLAPLLAAAAAAWLPPAAKEG